MENELDAGGPAIEWLGRAGLDAVTVWAEAHHVLAGALGFAVLVTLALFGLWLMRVVLVRVMVKLAQRSAGRWDDALVTHGVFKRMAAALPAVVVHQLASWVPFVPDGVVVALQRLALVALVVIALRTLGALFAAVNDIYAQHPMARYRPIKGYLQVVLIVGWVFGVVVGIAIVLDRSPWLLLSGLGAMTAVLLLVFRDTILSLVAGVQLTTNDLVRLGDWIEMPQFGADGDVIDIGLHAVKVQNWDRTITVIPTHRFLEHAFKNWRGMSDSGGRRIKRAVHIDMSTIRFLTPDEIERFGKFALLEEYMAHKRKELEEYNRALPVAEGVVRNERRLTNVGTLRAWIIEYLRKHPKVHQNMTFLIRQLAPDEHGLPIEIYVFCNDTRWVEYEGVQADIFDHVLAMVPQFGLRVFQSPSGHDIAQLRASS